MKHHDSDGDVNIIFGRCVFRKCRMKWFLILKVGDPFRWWLHVYSVFEFSHKTILLYFGSSWARLEKRMIQSAKNFEEHRFHVFQIFQKIKQVSRMFIFQVPESVCLGLANILGCQKNHGFLYRFEFVLLIWADPWYKWSVYMLESIWH